jgi:hypothetical protein
MDADAPLYCANHPNVETYLRCARCDKPICARCRVSTPAGIRCFECANLQVVPTYAVSSDYYLKAGSIGLLVAAAAGVLMGLFPAFEFWAALLMGIAVPEAVAFASNQKRSPGLQWVAMAAVVFGFALSRVVMEVLPVIFPLGGLNDPFNVYRGGFFRGADFFSDLPFYANQYTVLWLALALFLANRRLR